MLNILAGYITKEAHKQASGKSTRRLGWTHEDIKKNLEKHTRTQNVWTFSVFWAGLAIYGVCANLLKASFMAEHEALFSEEQRAILAKKAAVSILVALCSWLMFMLFILRLSKVI